MLLVGGQHVFVLTFLLACCCLAPISVCAAPQTCPDPSVCLVSTPNEDGSSIKVAVRTKIASGWSAFGVGESMSKADLVMVWRSEQDGKWRLSHRYSSKQGLPTEAQTPRWKVISGTTAPDQDGFHTIEMERPVAAAGPDDLPVAADSSWIWAFKNDPAASAQNLRKHESFGTFKYDALRKGGGVEAADAGGSLVQYRKTAVLAHAVLFTLAWTVLAWGGIFVARFMKGRLPSTWFQIHRGMLSLALLLTLIGFGLLMATARPGATHFTKPHSALGLTITLAATGQVILGFVIDKLFDPERSTTPLRDRAHWLFGYFLMIAAPINVLIGHQIYESPTFVVVGVYLVLGFFVAAFIYGQVRIGQTHDHKEGNRDSDMVDNEKPFGNAMHISGPL